MLKTFSPLLLPILLFVTATSVTAQTAASAPTALLSRLPPSEAVMHVDVAKLLAALSASSAPVTPVTSAPALATEPTLDINRELETFKNRTGINAREFDALAVSFKFNPRLKQLFPPQGTLQINPVVIARGRFNADEILRATQHTARTSTGSIAREKAGQYKNKTVYTVRLAADLRLFGLINLGEREVAIAVLDANTLALGKPSTVRAAIDAGATNGKRADAELVTLAARYAPATMVFAGRVPPVVSRRIDLGSPEISRPFQLIRVVSGSIGDLAIETPLTVNLQSTDEAEAANLLSTLEAFKAFVPGVIAQLPSPIARRLNVRDITISRQATQVIVRASIVR